MSSEYTRKLSMQNPHVKFRTSPAHWKRCEFCRFNQPQTVLVGKRRAIIRQRRGEAPLAPLPPMPLAAPVELRPTFWQIVKAWVMGWFRRTTP